MILSTALTLFLFYLPQMDSDPKVNRIYVDTIYDANIIFEYANASMTEGKPIKDGVAQCFASELKATGLFTDVKVSIKKLKGGKKVDVYINVLWHPNYSNFVIDRIILEGFTGINEQNLIDYFRRKGLTKGTSLLNIALPKIHNYMFEAVKELYGENTEEAFHFEEMITDVSFRIESIDSASFKLIIKQGHHSLCSLLN